MTRQQALKYLERLMYSKNSVLRWQAYRRLRTLLDILLPEEIQNTNLKN